MNYSKFSGLVACKMAMLLAFIKERRKRRRRTLVCLLFFEEILYLYSILRIMCEKELL